MKYSKFYIKKIWMAPLMLSLLALAGCTKDFEKFNTDNTGVTGEQLIPDYNNIGGFFPEMQYAIVPNDPSGRNSRQGMLGEYHVNCGFAGYLTECYPEEAPSTSYSFAGWHSFGVFFVGYNSVMAPFNHLRNEGVSSSSPHFWAVALTLLAAEMHKVTDVYGPVPFSKYGMGGTSVAYDSQQSIYMELFKSLDTAVANFKAYIAAYPNATPFKKFDVIYGGDYKKWLKYANSLRLRLAMHIVKVDAVTAQQQALKAIDPENGGVFTSNADNAVAPTTLNLMWAGSAGYTIRVGASIVTFMDGYSDPRIPEYFEKSELDPNKFIGLKVGSIMHNYLDLIQFSNISTKITQTTPGVLMRASEISFLRGEGVLRGWNMGGSAQSFYEEGIRLSMEEYGVGSAAVGNYINDETSTPTDHVDPLEPLNNSTALSTITIKWEEGASNEEKLERIITQKWIALYPDGTEGWANFRRTGYPKLLPVTESQNHSGGTIDTDVQVRRWPYPVSEYTNNVAEVEKAITLLGGPDHGGTRVWWDVPGSNF